jgi:hypothetical protein
MKDLGHHILNVSTGLHYHARSLEASAFRLEKALAEYTERLESGGPLADRSTETKVRILSRLFGVDPDWALAIAEVESAMGKYQKSPTGARGVFQMTSIAMKDLLLAMERHDDDLIDIACGILFMRLLLQRWGTPEKATEHYCDPDDRDVYVPKVMQILNRAGDKNE